VWTPEGADGCGAGLQTSSVQIDYERQNERVIVAKHDGEAVARIVQVPGGITSFRMEDGSRRGGPVDNVDEAKKQIERYLR
jgi:hypothetical protein